MVSRVKYIIPKKGERVSDAHVRRLYVQVDDRAPRLRLYCDPNGGPMTHKHLFAAVLLVGAVTMTGCKDATRAQFNALGSKHRITLYGATGIPIKTWESTGNVSDQENSDGWYFEDAATGKLVEVTGTLVIEQE
jgi:hypothetical protein